MEWKDLINLILNSIQIIGIFIAIIIGLIISKVMELKKERIEILEIIEDNEIELQSVKEQFNKLKKDNYEFYKKDNIYSTIELILDEKKFIPSKNINYITEEEQNDFYAYVKDYIIKIQKKYNDGASLKNCIKSLNIEKYSIEEIIVEELYKEWK